MGDRVKSDSICPLMKKPMHKVCDKCAWLTEIKGQHPQTGDPIDRWGCAIGWLPMLLLENSKLTMSGNESMQAVRNLLGSAASRQKFIREQRAKELSDGKVT